MSLAKLLVTGADLWLNTPHRTEEACTSRMKATFDGVLSLSIFDAWWIAGCFEGYLGLHNWQRCKVKTVDTAAEAASLYQELEEKIIPLYDRQLQAHGKMVRSAITLNGSFVNTQGMLRQYSVTNIFPRRPVHTPGELKSTLG